MEESDDSFYDLDNSSDERNENVSDFIDVVRNGDMDDLRHGLERFGSESCSQLFISQDKFGLTPFTLAAELGRVEVIKTIVEIGIDVDVKDGMGGWTALHYAASQEHLDVLKILLKAGAKIDIGDREMWTALHFASDRSNSEMVETLMNAGASIDCKTTEGYTPLYLASQAGHLECVKLLLSHCGLTSFEVDIEGWNPFHSACSKGHYDVLVELINWLKDTHKDKVDQLINSKIKSGLSLVYIAAQNNYQKIIKLLINTGVFKNQLDEALHISCQLGHLESVVCLVNSGASVNNNLGIEEWKPLHLSAQEGRDDVIEFLLESGAELDSKTKSGGYTALHIAAENGNLSTVKLLMKHGADVLLRDGDAGWCAIHHAAQNGHKHVVEYFLDNGVPINLETSDGLTSLHVAILNKQIQLVQMFLSSNINVQNNELATRSLLFACQSDNVEILDLLLETGIDIFCYDAEGWGCMHWCAEIDEPEMILKLAEYATNKIQGLNRLFEMQTNDGKTAFYIAAERGHSQSACVLMELGAQLDPTNNQGWTPLHVAAAMGYLNILKLMFEPEENDIIDEAVSINSNTIKTTPTTKMTLNCLSGDASSTTSTLSPLSSLIQLYINKNSPHNPFSKNGRYVYHRSFSIAEIERRTRFGCTALYLACQHGHQSVVEYLLTSALADPNASLPKNGDCPIHVSARKNYKGVAAKLLASGASPSRCTDDGFSPLHFAAQRGNLPIVNLLLEYGVELNGKTNDGFTPLMLASKDGHTKVVRVLLEAGAILDPRENSGMTALHLACACGHLLVTTLLMDRCKSDPLSAASIQGESEKYLIENIESSDVSQECHDQATPLYLAVSSGNDDLVNFLLNVGAEANQAVRDGFTPLHLAAQMGNIPILTLLLDRAGILGANAVDDMGWTPLFFSSQYGNISAVRILLGYGAEPNIQGSDGVSALQLAVQNGHLGVAEELVIKGAKVDAPNTDGQTALYFASEHGDLEMVQLLLFNQADPNYEDDNGYAPLHRACLMGHRKVAECLSKAGGDVNHPSKEGTTPVQMANRNGHTDILQWMLNHGGLLTPEPESRMHHVSSDKSSSIVSWGNYLRGVFVRAWRGEGGYVEVGCDEEMENRGRINSHEGRTLTKIVPPLLTNYNNNIDDDDDVYSKNRIKSGMISKRKSSLRYNSNVLKT